MTAIQHVGVIAMFLIYPLVVSNQAKLGTEEVALDRLGVEFDVSAHALMHLQVALDEIVSNVVKYSWPDGSRHDFLVRIVVSATGVAVNILTMVGHSTPEAHQIRNFHLNGNARALAVSVFI